MRESQGFNLSSPRSFKCLTEMKLLNWVQFAWDLNKLPPLDLHMPEHYQITLATADDEQGVRKVISSSLVLDPTWSPAMGEVMEIVTPSLEEAFKPESKSIVLALRHGTRVIGAAVLSTDPSADNHLLPGPCISMEYRNRGFGGRLLAHSLKELREGGLSYASGIARENAPVSRFLYPKFNGRRVDPSWHPLLAA